LDVFELLLKALEAIFPTFDVIISVSIEEHPEAMCEGND
jgi:hypothetical protein